MARPIVCLSFDFDALSGFISRGLVTPTPISRGEFGVIGAERIVKLLARFDIRATWFIPGHTLETYPQACRAIAAAGHEIAHHGWTHVPPADLSRAQEEAGLIRANEAIRRLTGSPARGYRSPSWDLSPHTIELLVKHGFLYDSSLMGHDYIPYHARIGDVVTLEEPTRFGAATALVEMPISWSLDDHPHFEYFRTDKVTLPGLRAASGVLENWFDDFDYMTREYEWGVITYTCHPYVIGRGHRMLMLERLIERLKARGAAFVTMEDAARQWLKLRE
jgi:peptidoglycan/xylan/chitin deacetylase (PgdA/CDA1 family)